MRSDIKDPAVRAAVERTDAMVDASFGPIGRLNQSTAYNETFAQERARIDARNRPPVSFGSSPAPSYGHTSSTPSRSAPIHISSSSGYSGSRSSSAPTGRMTKVLLLVLVLGFAGYLSSEKQTSPRPSAHSDRVTFTPASDLSPRGNEPGSIAAPVARQLAQNPELNEVAQAPAETAPAEPAAPPVEQFAAPADEPSPAPAAEPEARLVPKPQPQLDPQPQPVQARTEVVAPPTPTVLGQAVPSLGMTVSDAASQSTVNGGKGAIVLSVEPGSLANRIGFVQGDVVIGMMRHGSERGVVESAADLLRKVPDEISEDFAFTLLRDGQVSFPSLRHPATAE